MLGTPGVLDGRQQAAVALRPASFRFDDVEGGVRLQRVGQAFDRPRDPEVEQLRPSVERWLAEGQFEYNFGENNCWLDRSGEVTDT